jgi:hypothetical protein
VAICCQIRSPGVNTWSMCGEWLCGPDVENCSSCVNEVARKSVCRPSRLCHVSTPRCSTLLFQRGVSVSAAVAGAPSSKAPPLSSVVKDQQTSNIKQAIEFLREAGKAKAGEAEDEECQQDMYGITWV